MFLIIPKGRALNGARNGRDTQQQQSSHTTSTKTFRGPTRVQNACDECRLRKIKCNGEDPCSRCRARKSVCVFDHVSSKNRDEAPISLAEASLLKAQQARLIAALKAMSATIDDLKSSMRQTGAANLLDGAKSNPLVPRSSREPGVGERTADSAEFNLCEILERYAPNYKAPPASALGRPRKGSRIDCADSRAQEPKRRRLDRHVMHSAAQASMSNVQKEASNSLAPSQEQVNRNYRETVTYDLPRGVVQPTLPVFADGQTGPGQMEHDMNEALQAPGPFEHDIASLSQDSALRQHTFSQPLGATSSISLPEGYPEIVNDSIAKSFPIAPPASIGVRNDYTVSDLQMQSLFDMVDWDASWQSCVGMLHGNVPQASHGENDTQQDNDT